MTGRTWRSYFSPQEWAVFHREAARRGLTAEDLAAKYICRAIDRIELAEKYGTVTGGKLADTLKKLRRR